MKLKIKKRIYTFITSYAPTSSATDDEMEEFYCDLESTVDKNSRTDVLILLGDFNAKIGKPTQADYDVMGSYGFGERNERGQVLINFLRAKNFFAMNTMFKKNEKRRATWSLGRASNEIDYIFMKRNQKQMVKDYNVLNQFNFESDHKMVRMCIKVNMNRKKYNQSKTHVRITCESGKVDQANIILDNIGVYDESIEIRKSYEILKNQLQNASQVFECKTRSDAVLTAKTKQLIIEREELRKKRKQSDSDEADFKKKRKETNRNIEVDVHRFEIQQVERAIDRNNGLKYARNEYSKGRNWIPNLKDENGTLKTNRDEVLEVATKFYEKLYTSSLSKEERDFLAPDLSIFDEVEQITVEELTTALSMLKNGKAVGEDSISSDFLKLCKQKTLQFICDLFNDIIKNEEIPDDWLVSTIILIPKKGDKSLIENYRPISKTSHLYKLFMKIIQNRIKDNLEKYQPPNQAAFRRDYSTIDHLFTLNQIIEKTSEYNRVVKTPKWCPTPVVSDTTGDRTPLMSDTKNLVVSGHHWCPTPLVTGHHWCRTPKKKWCPVVSEAILLM